MRLPVVIALALSIPNAAAATLDDAHRAWEPRNYAEAFQAASFVADEDKTGEALYIISRIHKEGFGVARPNKEYALAPLRQAADRAYPVALSVLGIDRSYPEAVKWLRRAIDAGDQGVRQLMVGYYVNGTGVAADPVRAQDWALIAERQGDGISPEGRSVLDALLAPEMRTKAERLADRCMAAAKDCP